MVNNNSYVNDYTYGNTARELVPEVKIKKKPQVKQKKKPQIALKTKFKMMFSILVICVFSFMALIRFASIINLQKNIRDVREEITSLQNDNENVKVDIALHNNLKKLEEVAVNKYNMSAPQFESIYYVDVKPLTLSDSEDTNALSFFDRLLGLIN